MQKTKQPLLVKIWLTTFLLTIYCISACKNESDNTGIENYNPTQPVSITDFIPNNGELVKS